MNRGPQWPAVVADVDECILYESMMFAQAALGMNNDLYSNDVLTSYINIIVCLFIFLRFWILSFVLHE